MRPVISSSDCDYALAQLRFEAFARLAPDFEQPGLAAQHAPDLRVVLARGQLIGKIDACRCPQARLPRARGARANSSSPLDDDRKIGAGLSVVEPDNDVADADQIAVAHPQFGDDAAGRVLHFLHVGVDDELALRDHRAGELAGRGPSANAADQQHDRQRG